MKKGFTLVELSIVLVIIGLLIGGILVGQSLIETARINRFVGDLRQYDIAITQFKVKFKKYPGDSPHFSPPGNGNNILENNACVGTLGGDESTQFWAHLSQSKMIKTTYPSFSPDASSGNCGGTHRLFEDFYAGRLTPYSKVRSSAMENQILAIPTERHALVPIKGTVAVNLYIRVYTLPLDTLAIENKMGTALTDINTMQVGLTNNQGPPGYCAGDDDMGTPCATANATYGELLYFIAP